MECRMCQLRPPRPPAPPLAYRSPPRRRTRGGALGAAGLSVLLSRGWASVGQSWCRVMQRPWRFAAAQALQSLGGVVLALAGLKWRPGDPLLVLGAMACASLLAAAITPVRMA